MSMARDSFTILLKVQSEKFTSATHETNCDDVLPHENQYIFVCFTFWVVVSNIVYFHPEPWGSDRI